MEPKWKSSYWYYILFAIAILSFLFSRETFAFNTWGTISLIMLFGLVAANESWKAFKKSGKACICTGLSVAKGGNDSFHPYDMTDLMSKSGIDPRTKKSYPSFVGFATGGFVVIGFAIPGKDKFIVCPPEHIDDTAPALICHTKLHSVDYESLPDYVQAELENLGGFKLIEVKAKKNLYFGMTSKRFGTATSENLAKEAHFLDQTAVINEYKALLADKEKAVISTKSQEDSKQIVINVPK